MEEMEIAILAATTPEVQIWMNWMMAIFMTSLIFVWKYKSARIVFAAFVLTVPIAMVVSNISKSAHLIGIAHIILWGPLAYYLIKKVVLNPSFEKISFFGVWVYLLLATISISIVFDIRDITLVFMGLK